jgi:hypothetical protein
MIKSGYSPTMTPTPIPLICPPFYASNTLYATQNSVQCSFFAANTISITNCAGVFGASCVGDTLIRLFNEAGVEVAKGDDECGKCSSIVSNYS